MFVFFLALTGLIACTPTCEQTCSKILSCEEEGISAPEMNQRECENSCAAQANLYENEEDQVLEEAFDELKSCITEQSCQDLAEGVCYDPDLFAW